MITLTGITQKGKNVVQRDGSEWWICKAAPKGVQCIPGNVPALLITPNGCTRADPKARWIAHTNDENFTFKRES